MILFIWIKMIYFMLMYLYNLLFKRFLKMFGFYVVMGNMFLNLLVCCLFFIILFFMIDFLNVDWIKICFMV